MNEDLNIIDAFLEDQPQAAAGETKGAAGEFLSKPAEGSAVQVSPGKALPEKTEKVVENKSVGTHAKESLLPKVRKVADTKERAGKILGAAVPDISDVPVPSGGIGLLVFISILMVFAITTIKGTGVSRLQMIWGTMLGNYTLSNNSTSSSSAPSSSGGGGGAFGDISGFIQGGGA